MNAAIIVMGLFVAACITALPGVWFWFWARDNDLGFVALPAIVVLAAILAGAADTTLLLPTWGSVLLGILVATTYAVVTLLIAAAVDN